ncbi:MAG: hypothetical protein EA416_02290 [Trueperaceae bacterium]|nr:MAG: hypothetical protein EA416_02290 [Trueperaceae bacterium]
MYHALVIRTAPDPQRVIVGTFLVLAAVVFAVAPIPLPMRSAGIVLMAYLAFGMGGMPFAYLTALLAPPVGLIAGDAEWLVMLPIILSGNLLGMLALEFAWRYPALLLSPLLLVTPAAFVQLATQRELFAVALPWDDGRGTWLTLHVLVAVLGVLSAFVMDRVRGRRAAAPAAEAEPRASGPRPTPARRRT